MQYSHIYHAGNFADVFKHTVLVMLLEHLRQKEKPFLYIDTHAGYGRYDLTSELAQKTREHENGVLQLCGKIDEQGKGVAPIIPAAIRTYCNIICATNQQLRYYPGSPLIAQALLRKQDCMVLVELERECAVALRQEFHSDERVAVHHMDGYHSIKAFLPPSIVAPAIGRALVLLDPPFEDADEYQKICAALQNAAERFNTGTYLIWYPIKDVLAVKNFYRALKKLNFANILLAELDAGEEWRQNTLTQRADRRYENARAGLSRCGVVIVNAPWQFESRLEAVVKYLTKVLFSREITQISRRRKSTVTQWLIEPK